MDRDLVHQIYGVDGCPTCEGAGFVGPTTCPCTLRNLHTTLYEAYRDMECRRDHLSIEFRADFEKIARRCLPRTWYWLWSLHFLRRLRIRAIVEYFERHGLLDRESVIDLIHKSRARVALACLEADLFPISDYLASIRKAC